MNRGSGDEIHVQMQTYPQRVWGNKGVIWLLQKSPTLQNHTTDNISLEFFS